MTHPSDDSKRTDQRLVMFLQHHAPSPPAANPDLEDQLMAALPPLPAGTSGQAHPTCWQIWKQWWAVPALATSVLLVGVGMRSWQQSQPLPETAELNLFLAETWGGVGYGRDSLDSLPITADAPDEDWIYANYSVLY